MASWLLLNNATRSMRIFEGGDGSQPTVKTERGSELYFSYYVQSKKEKKE